ncbi:MAG: hypothetical protein ABIJ11_07845 [Elusimicrobiota bacterium]
MSTTGITQKDNTNYSEMWVRNINQAPKVIGSSPEQYPNKEEDEENSRVN